MQNRASPRMPGIGEAHLSVPSAQLLVAAMSEPLLLNKFVAEFIGTALLAFTVATAAGQGAALAAIGIGSTLMVSRSGA